MGMLYGCGLCCMIISIWGAVQLTVMGICYHFEVVTLLEDVEVEEYEDYEDFIKKTKHHYALTARNCWVGGGIYFVLIAVCYCCIRRAKKQMKKEALKLADDEYVCTPKEAVKKNPKKVK